MGQMSTQPSLKAAPLLSALNADELERLAESMGSYLSTNSGWTRNNRLESQVRLELYRQLLELLPKPSMPQQVKDIVDNVLRMHRITLS